MANDVESNPGPAKDFCDLSICHANIRSLKAKDRLLHVKCEFVDKYDIITLLETWLSGEDSSSSFNLPGYQNAFRRDRTEGSEGYGGVLAWVSNSLACKRWLDFEVHDIEAMWLEIRSGNKKFMLCVCYRPPDNNSFWETLQENLDLVKQAYNSKVMLIGDFNSDPQTRQGKHLSDFVLVNNLSTHIHQPTRITQRSASLLDQCISNFSKYIKETDVLAPVSSNDHCTIIVRCKFRTRAQKVYTRIMWNYKEADFNAFRTALSLADWSDCYHENDINKSVEIWTNKFLQIAKTIIPNKIVRVRVSDKSWYNGYLRRLNRRKLKLFKLAKCSNTDQDWNKFKQVRFLYHSKIVQAKTEYENAKYSYLVQEGTKNSKKWWALLKQVYKNNDIEDTIPPLEVDDIIISDDKEKAESFNEFFLSVTSLDDSNTRLPVDQPIVTGIFLDSLHVTESDVLDQLKILDINKSYGPDGISPKLIKEGGPFIYKVLQNLFNKSLSLSKFPKYWKKANITPLHKKGDKSCVNNYRPVSLLSVVGKIFEKIVFKYLYNYFRDNFLISVHQSGFLPGRSTVTQLLEVYHQFCQAVDANKEVRVIFLDISKAFDKVWHKGVLYKLQRCGIGGGLLSWFIDYLKDRLQRVIINGQHSSWGTVNAGVPQGSVLGPLLFLIYINDVVQTVKFCNIRLFADDTCLFIEVDNRNIAAEHINSDLQSIINWSHRWLITFAPLKTSSLIISNKKDSSLNPPVFLDGQHISEVTSHTHLGVELARNLRWNQHIHTISLNARRRLNAMIPLKFKLDRNSLEIMYRAFVLPTMEYAIVVWGGSYDSDILKLERIHVDGMRLVTGATARSNIAKLYDDLLWQSIKDRRDQAMLTMIYKIKNDLAPSYLYHLLPPEFREYVGYNLRNSQNILLPFTRLESFRRSFFPFSIRLWNALPVDTRSSLSVSDFKVALKQDIVEPNLLYYYGERWASVHHARIRIGCSKLNADLCLNLHVKDNTTCLCGSLLEDAEHYFLHCTRYNNIRYDLVNAIAHCTDVTVSTILHGDPQLHFKDNIKIFGAVHSYIVKSNRFT
jgi:hypothetical protein